MDEKGDWKKLTVSRNGRLDKVLSLALGQSRNQTARLIEAGAVLINGKTAGKGSVIIEAGQEVSYRFIEAPRRIAAPVDLEVEILYEDEELLVVNKPSGLVVHPAPSVKGPTLVDWLREKGISLSTLSGEERHGIVHRIDRETTGALVVAKRNDVHRILAEELGRREMGRYYLALIDYPIKENITVDRPIVRNPANRLKMTVAEMGRSAKTDFLKLVSSGSGTELIAARLHTGRTHQIRVHLASIGRHILGDRLYGFRKKGVDIPRVFLHARLLYLTHPFSRKRLEISAPLFDDMQTYLDRNFEREIIDEAISAKFLTDGFTDAFDVL